MYVFVGLYCAPFLLPVSLLFIFIFSFHNLLDLCYGRKVYLYNVPTYLYICYYSGNVGLVPILYFWYSMSYRIIPPHCKVYVCKKCFPPSKFHVHDIHISFYPFRYLFIMMFICGFPNLNSIFAVILNCVL